MVPKQPKFLGLLDLIRKGNQFRRILVDYENVKKKKNSIQHLKFSILLKVNVTDYTVRIIPKYSRRYSPISYFLHMNMKRRMVLHHHILTRNESNTTRGRTNSWINPVLVKQYFYEREDKQTDNMGNCNYN